MAEVRRSCITTTVREKRPRSHHKGATGSFRTGDQRYPLPTRDTNLPISGPAGNWTSTKNMASKRSLLGFVQAALFLMLFELSHIDANLLTAVNLWRASGSSAPRTMTLRLTGGCDADGAVQGPNDEILPDYEANNPAEFAHDIKEDENLGISGMFVLFPCASGRGLIAQSASQLTRSATATADAGAVADDGADAAAMSDGAPTATGTREAGEAPHDSGAPRVIPPDPCRIFIGNIAHQ